MPKHSLGFDATILNRLTDDPDSYALITGLGAGFTIWINGTVVCESSQPMVFRLYSLGNDGTLNIWSPERLHGKTSGRNIIGSRHRIFYDGYLAGVSR